jgi:hypothetical protein
MTDKPEPLTITDPHNVPVTFVNELVARGHLNGVVNLTFATARFTPTSLGGDSKIDADLVVTARLRMDMYCVQALYLSLGDIIQKNVVTVEGEKLN